VSPATPPEIKAGAHVWPRRPLFPTLYWVSLHLARRKTAQELRCCRSPRHPPRTLGYWGACWRPRRGKETPPTVLSALRRLRPRLSRIRVRPVLIVRQIRSSSRLPNRKPFTWGLGSVRESGRMVLTRFLGLLCHSLGWHSPLLRI
jgi:hypothetical protein